MKRKLISALCIMAVILSLLTACQKPDNGEGNADNGGAGDNGIVGDNDNTSKPRESITSLHYTGEGQKTDFGYRYSTEIEIGGGSSGHNYYPQGTGYSAHIDYKTDYSYYPVNDVKLNVFHGTNSTYLELHRLCVVGPDLKFQYLTEPDDMYHNDKYSITIETTDYSDTEHFCHYVYSYSEEVTIPAEFFEGDRGVIELYACAINGAPSYPDKTMRKVSDPAKLYYRRYNDTVRISSSELSLTESVITKESDVERSALSKDITYSPYQNGESVGSVVAYKVMLDDNSEDESTKRKIFVALKCDDSRYLVLLYDITGRYLRGFSFRYEGDVSFSFADTYAVVYLWDRALSFAWNSKDYTMGDPREIVDYLENDDIRKALDTLSAKTEAEEYTAELSGNGGIYNKLAVTVDENTVTLDFAQKSE